MMASRWRAVVWGGMAGIAICGSTWEVGSLSAQSPKSKSKTKASANPSTVKQLDARTSEMSERFLRDATDIARGYEDAGDFDRAKWLLEVLEKLDPKLPGLKDKIDQLTDKSLEATQFDFELDVSKGWSAPVAVVQAGRVVRIAAEGDYKLSVTMPLTAQGAPVSDNGNDLVAGIPFGALMGVIVDPKDKKQQPGKPFEIKAEREWTPRESGYLQLKLNLPNGHKSTGKLTIHLGGVMPLPN